MTHDEDDELAGINLHAWRVPPPGAPDRASILARALAPAAAPRRSRGLWMTAALAVANVVLAAIIVVLLSQRPAQPTVILPAGGGSVDAQTEQLQRHLADEEKQLEVELAEIRLLRAQVDLLAQKARDCDATVKHDHAVAPAPPTPAPPTPAPPPTPPSTPATTPSTSCDEVSCVLTNYDTACCAKYRKDAPLPLPPGPLESLDRAAISNGMASVKAKVAACATTAPAKGTVKIHVRVGANGLVTNVDVLSTPDPALASCVASAVARAVFPKTKLGGSFSYPFVF